MIRVLQKHRRVPRGQHRRFIKCLIVMILASVPRFVTNGCSLASIFTMPSGL